MCFLLKAAYFSLLRYREPEMLTSSERTHTTCLQTLVQCQHWCLWCTRKCQCTVPTLGPRLSIQQLLRQHRCQALGQDFPGLLASAGPSR